MGPMYWAREWGLPYGIYPWVSTLVMGNLMGRRFCVGRGCFFWGERGRGRGTPGHDCRDVFAGRREFQTTLMLYIIYYAVVFFTTTCLQVIAKGVLDPRLPWTDTFAVRLSTDGPETWPRHLQRQIRAGA
jgi:hypothetical protein